MERNNKMKRCVWFVLSSLLLVAAPSMAQDRSDHVEFGAFADYFRFSYVNPAENFIGLGGRAAFNVHPDIQIEAEMAYDFNRNYTTTYSNGVSTTTVQSQLRTLHGFFGPKFQTGSGAFRLFVTGKVGFDNFSISGQGAPAGFSNAVGLTNGKTDFAVYPGGGIEAFAGFIGVRVEAGDDIFFDNGAHNNLRASFGPQFRF
jgi:hypothetical protein